MMGSSWIRGSVFVLSCLACTTSVVSGSEWSEWSECTQTCGYGVQLQHRPCPHGNHAECRVSELGRLRRCKIRECPIDGGWSSWGLWRPCSKTCGEEGTRTRFRLCTNPRPRYGGMNCEGDWQDTTPCAILPPCPLNGGWSNWSDWSPCKARTCRKAGNRFRTRRCDNPRPLFGGIPCQGSMNEHESCRKEGCPVHGGWSEWRDSSPCSPQCGSCSSRNQTRTCDNPAPAKGGKQCQGQSSRIIRCEGLDPCPTEAPTQSSSSSSSSSYEESCNIPSAEGATPVEVVVQTSFSSVSSVEGDPIVTGGNTGGGTGSDDGSWVSVDDGSWGSADDVWGSYDQGDAAPTGANGVTAEGESSSSESSYGEADQDENNPATSPSTSSVSNEGEVDCTQPSDSSASSYCP